MPRRRIRKDSRRRPLRVEPLEDRRVLAAMVVTNNVDTIDGDTTSIAALLSSPGADGISIREAIEAANNTPGADEITFDFGHDGPEVIRLTLGQLLISEPLTISGPGPELLSVDAQHSSRVFFSSASHSTLDYEVVLSGMDIRRGRTTDATWRGGAIAAMNLRLTLVDCWVRDSYTVGNNAWGGGVFVAGFLTLSDTVISDNYTLGLGGMGGGAMAQGHVTVTDSVIANNYTAGANGRGGGLRVNGDLQMLRSTLDGNWTEALGATGGGVDAVRNVILVDSAIVRNHTFGQDAVGGGVNTHFGVNLINSTISGNVTRGTAASGAGAHVHRQIEVVSSTIVNNHQLGSSLRSAGIYQVNYLNDFPASFSSSIIALNKSIDRPADLLLDPEGIKEFQYNLIQHSPGSGITFATRGSNLVGYDPILGPLADHGGPTFTHGLLRGSPALDAGDPSIRFDPAQFDQRGEGFARVAHGATGLRIDIGAYEALGVPVNPLGDFNHDGIANLADYTVWRDTLGSTNDLAADASGSGVIDSADYAIWKQHYGNTTIRHIIIPPIEDTGAALDAALAMFLSPEDEPQETGGLAGQAARGAEGHRSDGRDDELLLGIPQKEDAPDPPRANPRKSAIKAFGEWGKTGRAWSLTHGGLEGLDEC